MWDVLWTNGRILTMEENGGWNTADAGSIACKDGKIVWIGKRQDLPDKPEKMAREVYNARKAWITPGLIDCHTHIIYGGSRLKEFEERLQGKTYEELARKGGGILSTVRATRSASEKELKERAMQRLAFLREEGVTTVEIKSGYGLDVQTELKMLRVARSIGFSLPLTVKTTFLGAHALPEEYKDNRSGYIDLVCEEMLPRIAAEGLADAVDAFCEHIGFTAQEISRVFDKAKELNLPVKLHAEQLSNQEGAALAARYNALSADHLEYVTEEGIATMATAGTVAALLPGAFYFLKETRTPPVDLLRKHNVPMAIATDCNPGSSPTVSLLLMLNMACTLFGLTPQEALAGVTRHAAKALGIEKTHGTLAVGKQADFVLWDVEHPTELCYFLGANPCRGIIQNGRMV